MSIPLPVSCECGSVTGQLRGPVARQGDRLRCYCIDCQTYAVHLSVAHTLLDHHGGTAIFETTAAAVRIDQGHDQLRALRLSPQGPLRWYARCCKHPIANTLASPRLPFVALQEACIRGNIHALGPKGPGVYGRDAHGDRSTLHAHDKLPFSVLLKVAHRQLSARLRGEHRHSAFFTPAGRPLCEPQILSREERARARALAQNRA